MSYIDAQNRINDIRNQLKLNTESKKQISPNGYTMWVTKELDNEIHGLEESGDLAKAIKTIKDYLDQLEKQLLEYKGKYGGKAISKEKLKETGEGTMMNWLNDLRGEIDEIITYHNQDITDHKKIEISMFSNTSTPDNGNKPSQGSGA